MSFIIGRGRYARETYPTSAKAGGGSTGCQAAVVFSPDPPCTPTTTIRSDRSANQSPITGTPVGATNLGSDTTGATTGVSANYATVSGGDQNVASDQYATVIGGLLAEALALAAVAGGEEAIAGNVASVALGGEVLVAGEGAVGLGLGADAFGFGSFAGPTSQATGEDSVAIGDGAIAGSGAFTFTIPAGGTLVTIPGDVTSLFTNLDSLSILPTTPKFAPANTGLTVASPPVFGGVNTTFNLSAPIDATTTAGIIADTQVGIGGAVIGGTTNQVLGDEGFIGGGANNRVEATASDARAGGVLAQAIRVTQDAWASGSDGTLGHIQTSKLVVNGSTPGNAVGESTDLLINSSLFFELEDSKAYALRLHVIATGIIGGVRNSQSFEVEVTASRDGGTTTVSAANTIVQQGDAGAASWSMTVTAGAGPDRLRFTFSTGATQAQTVIGARVEWTEVFLVVPGPT